MPLRLLFAVFTAVVSAARVGKRPRLHPGELLHIRTPPGAAPGPKAALRPGLWSIPLHRSIANLTHRRLAGRILRTGLKAGAILGFMKSAERWGKTAGARTVFVGANTGSVLRLHRI